MNNIKPLRDRLLEEATSSPDLLNDLAGLEKYVAESYQSRSLMELLQNADDAGADAFLFYISDDFVICANNGRYIDDNDLTSICRSAASRKQRGETIGYRGIGFKSVSTFAKRVSVFSGECRVTFSRELTQRALKIDSKVPLIRIPHEMELLSSKIESELRELQENGYTTFFIFEDLQTDEISNEIEQLPTTSLIFLNNVATINLHIQDKIRTLKSFVKNFENRKIKTIQEGTEIQAWTKFGAGVDSIAIPTNPRHSASFIHVFLPTEDQSGFTCLFNGDFSTDPARRHIIFDDRSNACIDALASIYTEALIFAISSKDMPLVAALSPLVEPSILMLQGKGFAAKFLSSCKKLSREIINNHKITPGWLTWNDGDAGKSIKKSAYEIFIPDDATRPILKFLGFKELNLGELIGLVAYDTLSYYVKVQIACKAIKNLISPDPIKMTSDQDRIFLSKSRFISLSDLRLGAELEKSFADDLIANGLSESDIKNFYVHHISRPFRGFETGIDGSNDGTHPGGKPATQEIDGRDNKKSLTPIESKPIEFKTAVRWRAVELMVMDALNASGFRLRDVSKSNLGYDLEGTDHENNIAYVEVKSITYGGEKFRLTNNEVALARELNGKYLLALALTSKNGVSIEIIRSPLNHLNVTRQCVQWVWEVDTYEFNPIFYAFTD